MGKGKSSATSATRKKHAKKNAPPPEEPAPKTKKEKKARGKKEPRQKIYIPPVKPAPVQPDPLETTGLAYALPPELLVVLRNFNKKSEVTKLRALEELQTGWVDKCGKDETVEYTLVEMLPVWLHHAPALFLHPSRRVRASAVTLHLSFLRIAAVKEQVFFFLRETASTAQVENLLGSWCVAANDVDKAVATAAMQSWKEAVDAELKPDSAALLEFVQRTALDPVGIYAYLNPVQPSIAQQSHPGSKKRGPPVPARRETPEPKAKVEEDEENEQDRKARLRFGALGALRWMLESLEPTPEGLLPLFGNAALLTSLQPNQRTPGVDIESFGSGQPTVRRNMWALLQTLLLTKKGKLQEVASELARAILRSAFAETDSGVQSAMWYPLLLFLKEFPNAWDLEVKISQDDEDDEADDEEPDGAPTSSPTPSGAYLEFLQFLQLGCSGSPTDGYPTVVVILSTIPPATIAASSPTPLDDLFSSFWAALDGRALSSLDRAASSAAFLSSLLECMILVLKRLRSTSLEESLLEKLVNESSGTSTEFSTRVVKEQLVKLWQEVLNGKLKVSEEAAAKSLIKTVDGLKDVDNELADAAWTTVSDSILSSSLTHSNLVASLVKELKVEVKGSEKWQPKLGSVVSQLAERSLEAFSVTTIQEADLAKQRPELLISLLNAFKQNLFSTSDTFRTQLDSTIADSDRAYELLRASPSVFLAIVQHRGYDASGQELARAAWQSALDSLAKSEAPMVEKGGLLKALVDAARNGMLPDYLKVYATAGGGGKLDDFVGRNVADVVGGSGEGADALSGVLDYHDFFISKSAFLGIFGTLCASLKSEIRSAFDDPVFLPSGSASKGSIPWSALENLLSLLASTYASVLRSAEPHFASTTSVIDSVAPDAFLLAYLLPLCEGIEEVGRQRSFELAKKVWDMWFKDALETGKDAEKGKSRATIGLREVRGRLKGFILATKTRVLPQTVLTLLLTPGASSDGRTGADQFFFSAHPEFSTDTILEFLPDIAELDSMLAYLLPTIAPNASMGILEPLVPPSSAYPHSVLARVQSTLPTNAMGDAFSGGRYEKGDVDVTGYDRYGYSAYARAVGALISVFARDRACVRAKEGVEMLRHAAALEVCAWDALCLQSSLGPSGKPQKVFGDNVLLRETEEDVTRREFGQESWSLAGIIAKVEQVTAYAFITTGGGEPWKRYVVESLAGATAKVPPSGSEAPLVDEKGDLVTGGVKKTMHATMNRLSSFVLDVIGRSVQCEVDLKAGVALSPSASDQRSTKEKAKGMKSLVVLRTRVLRRILERVFDDDEDEGRDDKPGAELGMRKEDVDAWVGYARRVERVAPLTSSTILTTLTSLGLDSPRLDRARNEFAASLLGVQPPKANTEGLEFIRALGLCVPNDDSDDDEFISRIMTGSNGVNFRGRGGVRRGGSDVIMLPVQRAVNVVRACQNWVEGQKAGEQDEEEGSEDEDDGVSEDLESAMLAVFVGLAPILQNVIGKHWEFMWDVVETVVENSNLETESTLIGLSHALKFAKVMEDLVRTNKQLKAEWNSRRVTILGNIKDLVLEEQDAVSESDPEAAIPRSNSIPRSACRELILSIVQSLPDELMDQDTLGKMCHLVSDPSIEVQRLSYAMLKQAAKKRTEWIVIEVGVGGMGADVEGAVEPPALASAEDDGPVAAAPESSPPVETEASVPVTVREGKHRKNPGRKRKNRRGVAAKDEGPSHLPKELLAILQRDEEADLFGWMLGWMLVFDLFGDASFKVKSMYIEQLRNLDLIGQRLLPVIVHLLRLDEKHSNAIKVELCAVDEFYVAYYDPTSAPALAAHLYYRALLSVPSLIYTWVLDCKDRQLTRAITTLTSAHFSPLIIRTELAHLKSPDGIAELSGEGLSVKVISGTGGAAGEVVAAYSVDEHQLEIRLRIPNDWPLHKIEVSDDRKVGVDADRWRAWVLGVQQTIWNQNGRIVDGLSLWKKNVIGHFEGQVECAICYSIISASDRTLPSKPCKTCKNRFHAGCLYKWFNTSHSSSCPLCRSNII